MYDLVQHFRHLFASIPFHFVENENSIILVFPLLLFKDDRNQLLITNIWRMSMSYYKFIHSLSLSPAHRETVCSFFHHLPFFLLLKSMFWAAASSIRCFKLFAVASSCRLPRFLTVWFIAGYCEKGSRSRNHGFPMCHKSCLIINKHGKSDNSDLP